MVRFEPIAVQVSGGHLLPPVQTLVATIIFAKAKMQIESAIPTPVLMDWVFGLVGDEWCDSNP